MMVTIAFNAPILKHVIYNTASRNCRNCSLMRKGFLKGHATSLR